MYSVHKNCDFHNDNLLKSLYFIKLKKNALGQF